MAPTAGGLQKGVHSERGAHSDPLVKQFKIKAKLRKSSCLPGPFEYFQMFIAAPKSSLPPNFMNIYFKILNSNSRIQSQYSEIKGIPVHQQRNCRNTNQEKNPIRYSNKKNKVPRNKPNQGGKRPVLRKLHNTEERN